MTRPRPSDRVRSAESSLTRIDDALADRDPSWESSHDAPQRPEADRADRIAHRVHRRHTPPPGQVITIPLPEDSALAGWTPPERTPPANMGPQPYRIDPWDAYVCRFDDTDDTDATASDEDGERWVG